MDLSIQCDSGALEIAPNHPLDRSDQAAKADRLDMIVGDVLARQCKAQINGDAIKDELVSNFSSSEHQHSHHDLCDDVPPTEADVPLHEWVSALTHPLLGPYPNGVTPRILDRLANDAGVIRFPDYARRRWHKMWSSSNHLCVYLSDEVKAGRLRRVRFGHYAGCFENHVSCTPAINATSIEAETNGIERCGIEPSRMNGNADGPKDENDICYNALEVAHLSTARPFPIMSLLGSSTRDRASSYSSQNGGRRRAYRATLSNGDDFDESHEIALKNGISLDHAALSPKRQKLKTRRHSLLLDEFGLPSLLEDPSFANVVFSMGIDVQSWSVEQSAAFVQDFGFVDGAEALVREEIDGTALMLLKRVDILDGLHLKIGPAVKLYRYIRALQKLVCRRNDSVSGSSNGDA